MGGTYHRLLKTNEILEGYKLIFLFTKLCEELKIKPFAVAGTLLGIIRNNAIIPCDFDFDVGLVTDSIIILLENKEFALNKYGLDIHYGGYLLRCNSVNLKTIFWLDIYEYAEEVLTNNKVRYCATTKVDTYNNKYEYFNKKDLFPLTKTYIGNKKILIYIPHIPKKYLKRYYQRGKYIIYPYKITLPKVILHMYRDYYKHNDLNHIISYKKLYNNNCLFVSDKNIEIWKNIINSDIYLNDIKKKNIKKNLSHYTLKNNIEKIKHNFSITSIIFISMYLIPFTIFNRIKIKKYTICFVMVELIKLYLQNYNLHKIVSNSNKTIKIVGNRQWLSFLDYNMDNKFIISYASIIIFNKINKKKKDIFSVFILIVATLQKINSTFFLLEKNFGIPPKLM